MNDQSQDQQTAETRLDELAQILDSANIVVHNFDGIIRRWTKGCERLYGWSEQEAVGRVVHELLSTIFPEPLEEIRNKVARQIAWQGELVHRHKDGKRIIVASRWVAAFSVDPDKQVIVQTNNDISHLKQMQADLAAREAHLRSILATVPEAMIVIDESGVIASFSTAAEKMFGYPAEDVQGRNVSMLMPSPDREAHDGYLSHYLTTGERRIIGYGRVVSGQRKDGTVFPMELSVGEAIANGKRIFTGFVRDLTSRHKIEEELRQSQKMEAIGQLTVSVR